MACSSCGKVGCTGTRGARVGACGGARTGCGSARGSAEPRIGTAPWASAASVGNTPQFPPEYNTPEQIAQREGYPQNWFRMRFYNTYSYRGPVYVFMQYNQPLTQQAHDIAVLAITAWNDGNALSADMRMLDWLVSAMNADTTNNMSLAIAQLQTLRPILRDRLAQLGFPVIG